MRRRSFTSITPLACVLAVAVVAPAQATYPGDPGRIAFGAVAVVGQQPDVYSVNPDGTGLRRLTENEGFDACAAYDARGERIAYCSGVPEEPGVVEIWTMRPDGSGERQLTDLDGFATFPDYSPSGHRIAFTWGEGVPPGAPFANRDIWETRATGRHPRNLTATPDLDEAYPAYSPNGRWIAFIRMNAQRTESQLWVMDRNGRRERQLTSDAKFKEQLPDWSPDGRKIVYAAGLAGDRDLWVVDADGGRPTNLTAGTDLQEYGPAWSPDGTRIAFLDLVSPADDRRVWTMRADGTDARVLVPRLPALQNVPAWQPLVGHARGGHR